MCCTFEEQIKHLNETATFIVGLGSSERLSESRDASEHSSVSVKGSLGSVVSVGDATVSTVAAATATAAAFKSNRHSFSDKLGWLEQELLTLSRSHAYSLDSSFYIDGTQDEEFELVPLAFLIL